MSNSTWELSESTPCETATTLIPANESLSYRFKASASFRVSRDVSSIKMQSNGHADPVAAASNLCRPALSVPESVVKTHGEFDFSAYFTQFSLRFRFLSEF